MRQRLFNATAAAVVSLASTRLLVVALILWGFPTTGWTQGNCVPPPVPCEPPGEYALAASYLPPLPPSGAIAMWIYGPIGENPGVGSIICMFPNPGGSATVCGGTGIPGAYVFQAQSGSPTHATVDGGSATCGGVNRCSGAAALLLPPYWVKPNIRGGPPQPPNGPEPPCPGVGNPVDVVTGNVWLDQTDATVPGLRTTLRLKRSYNSALATTPGREFGRGWSHGYENQITHPVDPQGPNPMSYFSLRLGDGRPLYFQEDPQVSLKFVPLLPLTEQSYVLQSATTPTTYTRRFPDGSEEVYNAAGRLISIADTVGVTTELEYDPGTGRLVTIRDAIGGRTLTLGYAGPSATRVQTLSGPAGLITTYSYTGDQLTGVEYADGDGDSQPDGGFTFVYGHPQAPNALTEVKDRDGKVLERHTYLSGKGITSEVGLASAPSEKYTLQYIAGGLTKVTDGRGNVTNYRHGSIAGIDRVWRIQGPCAGCPGGGNQTQEWGYDEQGRITAYTDGMGVVTSYTYVSHGVETETRRPTAPPTSANVHITSYTYHPDGRLHTKTDPNGAVTTILYVPAGPQSITETITPTVTKSTLISYTTQGKAQFITDPRQKIWELRFNGLGDLEWTKDPANNQTTFTYDGLGRLRQIVRPALPPPTPAIQEPIRTYDTLGRVRRITNSDDNSYTEFNYDGGGRRTRVRDALGRITDYEYDDNGRLEKLWNRRAPAADDILTQYGYDVMSNPTSITDGRLKTTTFVYDGYNRVWKVNYPGTQTGLYEEFTYDGAGRVRTRTDRKGVTTTFTHDGLGRLTRKVYSGPSTPDAVFTYDAGITGLPDAHKGRLTSASNGSVALAWTYDLAGQVLSEDANRSGGPSSSVAYTYDAAGNRETLTLNGIGTLQYTYDDRGLHAMIRRLPVGAGDYVIAHDAASRRMSLTFPSTQAATRTDYAYDARSRLSRIATSYRNALRTEFTYPSYDAVDNRLQRAGATDPAETYFYDDLYRLEWVKRGTPFTETYSYDDVGNRLSSIPYPSPAWSYGEHNQLLSYGPPSLPATMEYDLNGNLISKTESPGPSPEWTYEWDVENRLTRVTRHGAQVATYSYDPLGRRNQRNLGAMIHTYVYDGEDILIQDFGSGTPTNLPPKFYIHGPGVDEPLAVEQGTGVNGAIWYYHPDGLGSIARATDRFGDVTHSRQYDAFGRPEVGVDQEGYAFTGREWDPETGLYYYRARYYDPKAGRFISEDPIGFSGGINFYSYVDNNPTNSTDPTGLLKGPDPFTTIGVCAVTGMGAAATAATTMGIALLATTANVGSDFAPGEPRPPVCQDPPACGKGDDDETERICKKQLQLCLTQQTQNRFRQRQWGKKKDCGACYRECKTAGGAWPYYKCPLFEN